MVFELSAAGFFSFLAYMSFFGERLFPGKTKKIDKVSIVAVPLFMAFLFFIINFLVFAVGSMVNLPMKNGLCFCVAMTLNGFFIVCFEKNKGNIVGAGVFIFGIVALFWAGSLFGFVEKFAAQVG